MQVLFLFGAGASKYAGGVAPASPPDGKGLFEALTQHDSFFRDKIDPKIAQAFRQNFEQGMEELAAKQGEYITMFLIKMSQYFLQFHISDPSESLYVRLFELLRNKDFIVSTLNYDMLLEEAATSLGVSIRKILKLHGSPNYIPQLMQRISGLTIWPFPAEPTTPKGGSGTGAHTRGPVDVVDRKTAIARLLTADAVAPAISAFAVGKKVYDSPEFVLNLQSIFRKAVDEVGSVVIAGVELNQADEHIWEPLAKTKARIGVINPNYAPYQQWSATTGQTRVSQLFERVQDIFHTPSATRRFLDYL